MTSRRRRYRPRSTTTVPHVARVLDYLQGGTANYPIDREVADYAFAEWPGGDVRVDIGAARSSLGRIVTYLAREAGVRQFIDIGTGLPTANAVHQVAGRIAPETRTVYVDRDPVVVAHARYLLASEPAATLFLAGDFHQPNEILREAKEFLDFTQPVAYILYGILHFLPDAEDPDGIVRTLTDAVPSGSYVALSHFARADKDDKMDETFELLNKQWGESVVRRTRADTARFFNGLDIVEPGVVELPDWRPDPGATAGPRPLPMWCGLARKP